MKITETYLLPTTDICRLNLTVDEYRLLVRMINNLKLTEEDFLENGKFEDFEYCSKTLLDKLQNVKQIENSKKRIATTKANEAKINKSKAKIENAIRILKMEGKEPTAYKIAQVANISYNTANKYLK